MSDKDKLRRLGQLSVLMRDVKLHALEAAARARQSSLDLLAELDTPAAAPDLTPIVAAEVSMRYALWADQKRSEINLVLARQTAQWLQARHDAAIAFGREQAVQKLAERPK